MLQADQFVPTSNSEHSKVALLYDASGAHGKEGSSDRACSTLLKLSVEHPAQENHVMQIPMKDIVVSVRRNSKISRENTEDSTNSSARTELIESKTQSQKSCDDQTWSADETLVDAQQNHHIHESIWVEHPELAYAPAVVLQRYSDGALEVELESGEKSVVRIERPSRVLPSSKKGVSDLLSLGEFDLGPILHNIKVRYFREEIYTAIGHPILISVNPYATINRLYTPAKAKLYRNAKTYNEHTPLPSRDIKDKGTFNTSGHVNRKIMAKLQELPPHLFRVAQTAMNALHACGVDQSIIISGESGAGKTEATKILLGYFVDMTGAPFLRIMSYEEKLQFQQSNALLLTSSNLIKPDQLTSLETISDADNPIFVPKISSVNASIEEQVTESNHILETFGNAKTLRNDNSSRFGKFTQISFNLKKHKISGAEITNYLLEKSRIVQQQPDERNYHIFYQLCKGRHLLNVPLQERLQLDDPEKFQYLKQCTEAPSIDDICDFEHLLICLIRMQFSQEDIENTFQLLAGILHLGNVSIQPAHENGKLAKLQAVGEQVSNMPQFLKACELLGVTPPEILRLCQYQSIYDAESREKIFVRKTEAQVAASTGSIAKGIYQKLFEHLVNRINKTLQQTFHHPTFEQLPNKHAYIRRESAYQPRVQIERGKIGLLDIFGFEVFDLNSFEQLCINFANEKLQQYFNAHMFHEEQLLYEKEGIDWALIRFEDNKKILDTLTDRVTGIFPLLDSECLMPKSTDQAFLSKLFDVSATRDTIVTFTGIKRHEQFGIRHYAGQVLYSPHRMVDKNRDRIHQDVYACFSKSLSPLLQALFETNTDESPGMCPRTEIDVGRADLPPRTGFTQTSVSYQFRKQLDSLLDVLGMTTASYVRCIKPNSDRAPKVFDSIDILRQLKCAGILESIRIRKDGYPVRLEIRSFCKRYRVLLKYDELEKVSDSTCPLPQIVKIVLRLMNSMIKPPCTITLRNGSQFFGGQAYDFWQIGHTHVFLKHDFQQYLEERAEVSWAKCATCIARCWRGYRARKELKSLTKALSTVQSWCQTAALRRAFTQYLTIRHEAALIIGRKWREVHELRKQAAEMERIRVSVTYQASLTSSKHSYDIDPCSVPESQRNLAEIREAMIEPNFTEPGRLHQQGLGYDLMHKTRDFASCKPPPSVPLISDFNRKIRDHASSEYKHQNTYDRSFERSSYMGLVSPVEYEPQEYSHEMRPLASARLHKASLAMPRIGSNVSSDYQAGNTDTVARLLHFLETAKAQKRACEEQLLALIDERREHLAEIHQLKAEVEEAYLRETELHQQVTQIQCDQKVMQLTMEEQQTYIVNLEQELVQATAEISTLSRQLDTNKQNNRMLLDHMEKNSDGHEEIKDQLERQIHQLQVELKQAYNTIRMISRNTSTAPQGSNGFKASSRASTPSVSMHKSSDRLDWQKDVVRACNSKCDRQECQSLKADYAAFQENIDTMYRESSIRNQSAYIKIRGYLAKICDDSRSSRTETYVQQINEALETLIFNNANAQLITGNLEESPQQELDWQLNNASRGPPVEYKASVASLEAPNDYQQHLTYKASSFKRRNSVLEGPRAFQRHSTNSERSSQTPFNETASVGLSEHELCQLTSRTINTTSRITESAPRVCLADYEKSQHSSKLLVN